MNVLLVDSQNRAFVKLFSKYDIILLTGDGGTYLYGVIYRLAHRFMLK